MKEAERSIPDRSAQIEEKYQGRLQNLKSHLAQIHQQVALQKEQQHPEQEQVLLIIDENENIRTTVKSFYESYGFNTVTAGNGLEALSHFKDRSCNLILLLPDFS